MDRKSIIFLAICFGVLAVVSTVVNRIYPPVPVPVSTNAVVRSTNPATAGTVQAIAGLRPPVSTVVPQLPATGLGAAPMLSLTNSDAIYRFSARGGGLQLVELLRYPETVQSRKEKGLHTNNFASLNSTSQAPVLALLTPPGVESFQGDGIYSLSPIPNGVHAEKVLSNGLSIIKEYRITSNYLINATVKLVNKGAAPINLPAHQLVTGTGTPMDPLDNGMAVASLWYNGSKPQQVGISYFATNTSTLWVIPRTPKTVYNDGLSNVVWTAVQNQYFTLAVMPTNPAPAVSVWMVDLPAPSDEELRNQPRTVAAPKGLLTALDYPAQTLAPGTSMDREFNVFAGPKEYQLLAHVGDRFNNDVDVVMSFNGFIGTFAKMLLIGMNWFHAVLNMGYGWAIVTITVLLKLLFWPLTQYSTRSAKRMAALQPQMKLLQAKYKDEPAELSRKQMEFWKKNKVNPLSGCLPLLLQMPVLFGFYRMLQSAIELRGAPFLWAADLSKSDTIYTIFLPAGLPLLPSALPINPMPLLMGATMFWQIQLTPPAPGMDPSQQKMMRYMPLIMLVVLYNFSSGLALYWTVQNLLTVLQTKMTKAQPTEAVVKPAAPVAPQKKK